MDWSGPESSVEAEAAAPLRLFGIGHSHLTGLQHADGGRDPAPGRTQFRFLQLLERRFLPNLAAERPAPRFHPTVLVELAAALADPAIPLVVAAISGNEYHSLGMVNHPRKFDFVLREAPDIPLLREAEIVPAALVEAALAALMSHAVLQLEALRRITSLPIVTICSPPPVPDDSFVAQQDTMFTEPVRRLGVSPAPLRWKLWRLQSRLYRQACEANGIIFLPPPPETLDADGFLVEFGWHPDSVHGNIWYGERVLRQIEAHAGVEREAAA